MIEQANNRIIFKVPSDLLWENIKAKTAYRAKFAAQGNALLIDSISLTDSDTDFLTSHLKDAVMVAHSVMFRLMHGIPYADTYAVNQFYNDDQQGDGTDAINPNDYPLDIRQRQSRIVVNDNGKYTDAVLADVDNAIFEVICNGLLFEWFKKVGSEADAKNYAGMLAASVASLKKSIVELFKTPLS